MKQRFAPLLQTPDTLPPGAGATAPTPCLGLGAVFLAPAVLSQGLDSAAAREAAQGQVLFWAAVLVGAAVLLGAAFYVIRKWMLAGDDRDDSMSMGFTLADLRQMHSDGQLSDEEFDYAKRKMTARMRADLEPPSELEPTEEPTDLGDITGLERDNPPLDPPASDNSPGPGPTGPPRE